MDPNIVDPASVVRADEPASTEASDPSEVSPHIRVIAAGNRLAVFLRDRLELRLLPAESRERFLASLRGLAGTRSDARGPQEGQSVAVDRLLLGLGPSQPRHAADPRPSLDRLTLTVCNVCNLGCSYCYAAKGTYYNKKGLLMSEDTLHAALDRAAQGYSRIEHVNFFGGEPTLNCDAIRSACEYTQQLYEQGALSHIPSFGITTNGYALSGKVLELLERYRFSVTLSLDGPREIQDAKRPTISGRGTYETVVATARKLVERGLAIEFECTYSNEHLRRRMNIVDLMDFFHAEFDCRTLHCQIVSAAPSSPEYIPLSVSLRLLGDAIEASIVNLASGVPKTISLAVRMLHSLTSGTPIWNYCPAGRKEVTVNADGDVYSCFMLMQTPDFSFGNVLGDAAANGHASGPRGAQKDRIEGLLLAQDKYKNPACQRCWAQPLCHGCLGEDFERTGGNIVRSEIPGVSAFCDFKRGLVERFLLSIEKADSLTAGRLHA